MLQATPEDVEATEQLFGTGIEDDRDRPPAADPPHADRLADRGWARSRSSRCSTSASSPKKEPCTTTTAGSKGARLVDQDGRPVKLGDIDIGGLLTVFPGRPGCAAASPGPLHGHPDRGEGRSTVLHPAAARASSSRARAARTGPTKATSRTPRSAPTRAARSAVRAADAPPAVPVPPVGLRRDRRLPAASSARPPGRCLNWRSRVDDEGYFIAQGDYQRACRSRLLGARTMTRTLLQPEPGARRSPCTSTTASARRASCAGA